MPQEKIIIKFLPDGHEKLIKALNNLAKAQKKVEKGLNDTKAKFTALNPKMLQIHAVLKKQGKGWKELGISIKIGTQALQGNKRAIGLVNARLKAMGVTQQRINDGTLLQVRNNRLLNNTFATLRSKMLLFTFAMSLGIRQLLNFAQEAAKVESMGRAFDTLSGGTGKSTIAMERLKVATNGTMSQFNLFQQANNAMILGVSKNSEEMAEMFDIAQRLGRALGRDTASSVESLITGIGRQSRLMLDNIGIIVKAEEAYISYAEKLGKTTDALTDSEKKTAFLQATMTAAREKVARLGDETMSSQDSFDRFKATTSDLAVAVGDSLVGALSGAMDAFSNMVDRNKKANVEMALTSTVVRIIEQELARLETTLGKTIATQKRFVRNFQVMAEEGTIEILRKQIKQLEINLKAATLAQNDFGETLEDEAFWTDSIGESLREKLAPSLSFVNGLYAQTKVSRLAIIETQIASLRFQNEVNGMTNEEGAVLEYLIGVRKKLIGTLDETQTKRKGTIAQQKLQMELERAIFAMDAEADELETERFDKMVRRANQEFDLIRMKEDAQKRLKDALKVDLAPPDPARAIAPLTEALDVQFGLITEDGAKRLELERQVQNETIELFKSGQMTEIEAREHYNERMKELIAALAEEEKKAADEKKQQLIDNTFETAEKIVGVAAESATALIEIGNNTMQADIAATKESSEYKLAKKRGDNDKMAQLEKDAAAKTLPMRKKAFVSKQLAAYGTIAIDLAAGIQKAYGDYDFFSATIVSALLAGIAGLNATAVATQQAPTYAKGGMIGGRRHSQGGTMINAEAGEFVMSRSAVESVGIENLNRMNEGGGGGAVTVNVSGNVLSQDFVEGELAENIKEAIRRGTDFGIS